MRRPGVHVYIKAGAHLLVCCNIGRLFYYIFLHLYCGFYLRVLKINLYKDMENYQEL